MTEHHLSTPYSWLRDAKFLAGMAGELLWASRKKSLERIKMLPLKSLVTLGSSFYTSILFSQQRILVALGAALPKRRWNAHCTEITYAVLLNCRTQRDFCCALIITGGIKKNVKQPCWKKRVCVIMTSQRFRCEWRHNDIDFPKFYFFPFLSSYVSFVGDL